MQTLLITGARGRIGSAIRPLLRQHYKLRLLDCIPIEDLEDNEEAVKGDLVDPVFVESSSQGVDGILHLACVHGTQHNFESTLDVNYRATLNLLEAARLHGVSRFIFASSHHTIGQYKAETLPENLNLTAPDSYYGLSKVFGEAACAMYSHRFGIRSLAIRIGNADPTVVDGRRLRIWLSAEDLVQLINIGMTNPSLIHEVVYGVSKCPGPMFYNPAAERLGYSPQDFATDNLDLRFTPVSCMSQADGPSFVGGAYAAYDLPKPGSKT